MPYEEYAGRTEIRRDVVAPHLMQGLAATLGVPVPDVLPPLWHWTLFQDWLPPDRLGPDGHPRRGGFLPPVHDLPRRMWAGGRVQFHAPLHPGDAVERTTTILGVDEKHGSTGRLVFVTLRHAIAGPAGPAITEEQDLVYRGTDGAAAKPGAAASPVPDGPRTTVLPDAVTLFRYSALTGNGHRIHYDADYARGVEGYPGLVVHGPLQATWLAGLLRAPPARFHFRGRRAAFAGSPLRLEGWAEGGATRLRTVDADGCVCMEAEAYAA